MRLKNSLKFLYIFISIIMLFISCDVKNSILVVNSKKEQVIVTVFYNKEHFSYFYEEHKSIDFLNNIQMHNSQVKMINCDTLKSNLSLSFRLSKYDTLYINKSRGIYPNYHTIDSVLIFKNKKLRIKLDSDNFDENFIKKNNKVIYKIK